MIDRRALLAGCAALLLTATAPAHGYTEPELLLVRQQQAEPLGLGEAAELVRSNGQTYYLIRVLVKKGQVKVYRVDPHSGRLF
jgi:DNA-binding PadR family transcriptional regulator